MLREDITYLEGWIERAKSYAASIRSCSHQEGGLAIFTISSTVKTPENKRPYLTPVRRITHGFVGGSVVFSQTQAILLSKAIDGLVDTILVDTEKKIGIQLGVDEEVLRHFGLEQPPDKGNARVNVEMGNLSGCCVDHIRKSQFHEYKPNDMTVESVWHLLSSWFRVLSGKKAAILGGGNIGFKLALKLVESGCDVDLVRRDLSRGMLMTNVINIVIPKSTVASAHYNADPLQAALFADVIVGCTDGTPIITWEMIQAMKPNGIVIDVAKGSVFQDAVQMALEKNIVLFRCDVSSGIDGLIATIQRNKNIMSVEMGRKEFKDGVFVVSGGRLGLSGDIVVDNYMSPKTILGVADGSGDFKEHLSEKNRHDLGIVHERIQNKKN